MNLKEAPLRALQIQGQYGEQYKEENEVDIEAILSEMLALKRWEFTSGGQLKGEANVQKRA